VTLNDPQFVEAARVLAERMMKEGRSDAERLRWGFVECTARVPETAEMAVLQRALARERARYAEDSAAAEKFLLIGEAPRDSRIAPAEHAAWAQVAVLLLNLSEAVTRN
jgi:hypothetical protein